MSKKYDIGLMWARFLAIYGQMSVTFGVYNFVTTFFVSYVIVVKEYIPLPLYFIGVIVYFSLGALFVNKIGISGYYRFLNQQSKLEKIDRKLNIIMEHLKLDDKQD